VSIAPTGQTCYIAFAFIRDEKQSIYEAVLKCLAEAYNRLNLQYPQTILTDKELALINSINTVFPRAQTIICIWHIQMNLLTKARPLLSDCLATARRDGLPLPDDLSFELD
jgi:transposase-like protein